MSGSSFIVAVNALLLKGLLLPTGSDRREGEPGDQGAAASGAEAAHAD